MIQGWDSHVLTHTHTHTPPMYLHTSQDTPHHIHVPNQILSVSRKRTPPHTRSIRVTYRTAHTHTHTHTHTHMYTHTTHTHTPSLSLSHTSAESLVFLGYHVPGPLSKSLV